MALAYRDSAQVLGATSSTNITIPASVQVGDLLILQAVGGWAPYIPSGWTQNYLNNSSSNVRGFVAYRVAQSGDAGSALTVNWEGSYNHVINLIAVSGGTTLRSTTHAHSASGGNATTGPSIAANSDFVVYFAGNRQGGGPPTLSRGTTTYSSGTTFGGVVAYDLLVSDQFVSNTFTSDVQGNGYLYSMLIVDGGGTPGNLAVVEAAYVDALTASEGSAQVESNYSEVLLQGVAAAQIGSDYVDVLGSPPGQAQVETNYVEVISSAAGAQVESVYSEALINSTSDARVETVYAEALANADASAQIESYYTEALISSPRLQAETVYGEVLASGTPNVQAESVYGEVLSGGTPNLQSEVVYAEVLVSLTVFANKRGWGITSI